MSAINNDPVTELDDEQEGVFKLRHAPKYRDFKQELESFLATTEFRNVDYATLLAAAKQIAFEGSQERFISEASILFRMENRHGLHGLRKYLRR